MDRQELIGLVSSLAVLAAVLALFGVAAWHFIFKR